VAIVGYILTALVAYLLGSIPTGFLVGKARGIDIRAIGSGNIGATNVFRALGIPAGVFVMFCDAAKGWIAVKVAAVCLARWIDPAASQLSREWFCILAGVCVVLGHNYTCWLHFKGGKGIATSAGVLLELVPEALLIILAVFVIVLALTRIMSLASIAASFTLPFATWLRGGSLTMIIVTGALAVLAIYKHKANIRRLLNGTEGRIGVKTPAEAPK
jgi:glycerol-3-phosphate acyltransferase PlsY